LKYDIVFGRDFLLKIGLDTCFSTRTTNWLNQKLPMKTTKFWEDPVSMYTALNTDAFQDEEAEFYGSKGKNTILDAKYEKMDTAKIAQDQLHLTQSQRDGLAKILSKHETLFDGTLGKYPHKKIHLELEAGAVPVHQKAYPVAHAHSEVFQKELRHLVEIGVLERCGATEWASPTFIIPKKDGRIRWVSDFRQLNAVIKRKQYPLPVISDVLRRRSGYKFLTKIDLTMCYYTYELDDESAELCIIVTPYGKFKYRRLPMGVKQSPDFAQEIIEHVLRDLDVETYIDDIGAFDMDWDSHLKSLDEILRRLKINGFKVNPLKCEWGVQETDFLGYWLTPTGLKPWTKKIDAILRMDAPKNVKQTRSFLGAVTYYRDMWPKRSHILTPLTELTGKGKFVWEQKHQLAFEQMKSLMAKDALLAYPNHNLPFEIYTDASDYQLGAVIMQNGKPVAYYSRKLNAAQRNYTTMEKELLSVVMTLREFHTMLYGAVLTVFTDHKNLTFQNLNSQRVVRWRNYLEEYNPTFKYIKGPDNVIADAFSRVPVKESAGGDEVKAIRPSPSTKNAESFSIEIDDSELLDCFLNHPPIEQIRFPLDYEWIRQHQFEDEPLQQLRLNKPLEYPVLDMGNDLQLICRVRPDRPWQIAIPTALLDDIVTWYHQVLGHVGIVRLYQTIVTHFVHPELKSRIEFIVKSCDACLRSKLPGMGYGELPPREAGLLPWNEVAVDLIGPWTLNIQGAEVKFNALTCIDPVSNLVEIARIHNKTAAHVGTIFENTWIARYPRPLRCIHDNGGEFIGADFLRVLETNGIKDVPTTVKNPQSNAICERMHQTAGNILRTLEITHPPQTLEEAQLLVDSALATTMHATRTAIHTTLRVSPGAFVFQRDMFLDIPIIANMQMIQERRQILINENLRRQNLKRRSFDYAVNGEVLVKIPNPSKLQDRAEGPFTIQQVHTNGTLTIQRAPHVTERINIRRLVPYRRP
jgi:transposase InsO family protein